MVNLRSPPPADRGGRNELHCSGSGYFRAESMWQMSASVSRGIQQVLRSTSASSSGLQRSEVLIRSRTSELLSMNAARATGHGPSSRRTMMLRISASETPPARHWMKCSGSAWTRPDPVGRYDYLPRRSRQSARRSPVGPAALPIEPIPPTPKTPDPIAEPDQPTTMHWVCSRWAFALPLLMTEEKRPDIGVGVGVPQWASRKRMGPGT